MGMRKQVKTCIYAKSSANNFKNKCYFYRQMKFYTYNWELQHMLLSKPTCKIKKKIKKSNQLATENNKKLHILPPMKT